MKCIYCNSEEDLTVSDIIPYALTGAKLKKRFVCKKHNAFTNDNYEKIAIKNFAFFRNLLGLTERDGGAVHFVADLEIGEYSFKDTNISDKASLIGNSKRKFKTTDNNGKKILLGNRDDLMKISGASEDKIKDINFGDVTIISRSDLQKLFISSEMLHTVAKVAYEWFCFENNIVGLDEKFNEITSYILDKESKSCPVEILIEPTVNFVLGELSRNGTNLIFNYNDKDGNTYVVFCFWGVITYKIKVCKHGLSLKEANVLKINFYHVDGSKEEKEIGFFGESSFRSEKPSVGLSLLCKQIKKKLSNFGERDLTKNYIKKNIENIEKLLPSYKKGDISLADLMDYEHEDRVIPIYIVELIYKNREKYDMEQNFTLNMRKILGEKEKVILTNDFKREIVQKYIKMHEEGSFVSMIEEAIKFFKTLPK